MDNKSDRKFYWEVKNFMNKPVAPSAPKQSNKVVDSVKSIIEQNRPYTQSTFSPNSNSINTVRQVIANNEINRNDATPECKAFTKNQITNPFNTLNEVTSTATKVSMGAGGAIVPKPPTVVNIPPRIPSGGGFVPKLPPPSGGVLKTLPSIARTGLGNTPWGRIALGLLGLGTMAGGWWLSTQGGDETQTPTTPTSTTSTTPTPTTPTSTTPTVNQKPSQADLIAQQRKAMGMYVPVLSHGFGSAPGNYKEWHQATQARQEAIRDANIAIRSEREAKEDELHDLRTQYDSVHGKDIFDLTAKLRAAKEKAPGGTLDKLKDPEVIAAQKALDDRVSAAKSTPLGQEISKKSDQMRRFNDRTMKRSPENLGGAGAALASRPDLAGPPHFSPDTKIQGTDTTYGEWSARYGHPYDAMNADDRQLAITRHSMNPSLRYTPAGQEAVRTGIELNQQLNSWRTDLQRQQGESDRAVDRSRVEYDRYRTDPEYRRLTNATETARQADDVARSLGMTKDELLQKSPWMQKQMNLSQD